MTRISVVPDAKPAPPTRGTLGISAQAFLAVLSAQQVSGTLYLSLADGNGSNRVGHDSSVLLNLGRGEPQVKTEFGGGGAAFDFAQLGATFSLWPPASPGPVVNLADPSVPALPGRYPVLGPLWALPALTERTLLSTAETGLRELVARLSADAFGGAVVLTTGDAEGAPYGLLLFQDGQLAGAVYGEGALQQRGAAALRTLTRLSAALTLHALPEPVVAGLLGWLLGLQLSDLAAQQRRPDGFSGLELTATGARFYRAGTPYLLQLRPEGLVPPTLGLFAACQHVPSLTLPGEPSGWEGRRYGLTLRGRDALNPMTELSMRFQGDFGRSGRRALEQFRRDLSVEVAAGTLGLEVAELGGLVERLEAEGFVRTVGDTSPTAHLQPR